MKSLLFDSDRYLTVQIQVKDFLNKQVDFLSGSTAKSPRAVGDAIQEILAEHFPAIVGDDVCGSIRRSLRAVRWRIWRSRILRDFTTSLM